MWFLHLQMSQLLGDCSGKRSFSNGTYKKLSRTTTSQDRLNSLAVMSIESDIAKHLDYSDVIDEFAHAKVRKRLQQKSLKDYLLVIILLYCLVRTVLICIAGMWHGVCVKYFGMIGGRGGGGGGGGLFASTV